MLFSMAEGQNEGSGWRLQGQGFAEGEEALARWRGWLAGSAKPQLTMGTSEAFLRFGPLDLS